MNVDKIEADGSEEVTLRYIARNETKYSLGATDMEFLQEIVYPLEKAYSKDLDAALERRIEGDEGSEDDDSSVKWKNFSKAADEIAVEHKEKNGYKKLFGVTSFSLSLVMASRIRRHYTHATWFRANRLTNILETHGAVSQET